MNTKVIGVTGGIASGKSCVSRLLAAYCQFPLIDIDVTCRELMEQNQPGWAAVRQHFGEAYFHEDGALNRAFLREKIFSEAPLRKKLDQLMHPLARQKLRDTVSQIATSLVFVEIPLLFEAGWTDEVDVSVVVYADKKVQCQRIVQRDKVSEEQAREAVDAQMDMKKKRTLADYVITNSEQWYSTRKEVLLLAEKLEGL